MTETLTIGDRVAFYRRGRGQSQEVLAGLIGRTEDWLSRVENNKIDLDRLSVIRRRAGCQHRRPGRRAHAVRLDFRQWVPHRAGAAFGVDGLPAGVWSAGRGGQR